jgi:hypothetical protein
MKFKHYILTRYNLGIYDKNNPYSESVGNPEEWMKHRMPLFQKCIDGMIRQTNQKFIWVIAVDEKTDIVFKTNLERVKIVNEQPHQWLRRQPCEAEWIITSRLDNDDYYHMDFVKKIQENFREVEEVIDIDYEVLESYTGIKYPSKRERANSPFLSLVEKWTDKINTAMGRPHTVMPDIYHSRKLGVLATQVIHDKNVCNKIPK